MQSVGPGRDPAPSRWSYRWQRWLLTPGIRLGLRIGIPFAVVFGLTSGFLADEDRRDALNVFVADLREDIQERPEFMVNAMAVDGAGRDVAEDIHEIVPLDFPVSQFDLDLEQIRSVIVGLDPVKSASLRVRPGGVLQVDVVERRPVVLWRTRDGIEVLDETGTHVGFVAGRAARADLPIIAGEAADSQVTEALALVKAARPLGRRMRGLVRVGARRWDVVLDRGQRILLPETNPVRALERVIALGEAREMLERDMTVIDMRLSPRPTIRMSQTAVEEWRKIRSLNESGQ